MQLNTRTPFSKRHLASEAHEVQSMLDFLGLSSTDELIEETLPSSILDDSLQLQDAQSEDQFLKTLKQKLSSNKLFRSFIGQGYYNTLTPGVIQRNILENPGWYTAYTPYQAEISQGRMEMLVNFQTVVCDLTGMDIANASLLDEATAAAESMSLFFSARKGTKKNATVFLVDENVFPQTLGVIQTRAKPLNIDVRTCDLKNVDFSDASIFGALAQNPGNDGLVSDWTDAISTAHEQKVFFSLGADLLASVVTKSVGSMGADIAFGSSQRFGVPMGYGGPHAAFFATKEAFKRLIPGRIIGISKDKFGKKAYRMALQTREQHIRREKATSNICTAQVLLAVMAGAYAVYHGPKGLKNIASAVHANTSFLASTLQKNGFTLAHTNFFDTITVLTNDIDSIRKKALAAEVNLRYSTNGITISLDEAITASEIKLLLSLFDISEDTPCVFDESFLAEDCIRKDDYLTHPVFLSHHSEHDMLRYLKRLENKDVSMAHSMISLGSCTMKLNATTQMMPVTWPEIATLHPFVPVNQVEGILSLIHELENDLSNITGFSAISLQPNSGAQGELAGLLVIKEYLTSIGQGHRNIALIPASAHGTNPATAAMTSMKVVVVACDEKGNIDIADLEAKAELHSKNLAALMVTYPSTHGVFEEAILHICEVIHEHGGQVYMDGANLNAQLGLTSPGFIGADVCHLNLHKTFAIPHGGGGPGIGPIGVASHLKPFLPSHNEIDCGGESAIGPVSAAPYGSAGILCISYAYIKLLAADGLRNATKYAILNANYMMSKLETGYPILYKGSKGRCAHEFILDCRSFKASSNIQVEDIAKRLMDYGFHSPTVSFPVAGTLMIEPTESEPLAELDRFVEALLQIRAEIQKVEDGEWPKDNNPLINAPHPVEVLYQESWEYAYSREEATFPLAWVKEGKIWPTVGRVDNAYGDRNLFCSCPPMEE